MLNGKGGILTMWIKSVLHCEKTTIGNRFIAVLGEYSKDKVQVGVINIYSSSNLVDKHQIWNEIRLKQYENCNLWNALRKSLERRGVNQRVIHLNPTTQDGPKDQLDNLNGWTNMQSNKLENEVILSSEYTPIYK